MDVRKFDDTDDDDEDDDEFGTLPKRDHLFDEGTRVLGLLEECRREQQNNSRTPRILETNVKKEISLLSIMLQLAHRRLDILTRVNASNITILFHCMSAEDEKDLQEVHRSGQLEMILCSQFRYHASQLFADVYEEYADFMRRKEELYAHALSCDETTSKRSGKDRERRGRNGAGEEFTAHSKKHRNREVVKQASSADHGVEYMEHVSSADNKSSSCDCGEFSEETNNDVEDFSMSDDTDLDGATSEQTSNDSDIATSVDSSRDEGDDTISVDADDDDSEETASVDSSDEDDELKGTEMADDSALNAGEEENSNKKD